MGNCTGMDQKQVARLLVGSIKRYQVSKGNSYRIFSTVKAYKGTDSESIAVYSNIVNY